MNNIIANFGQILDQAEAMGVPKNRRRGILREYLQTKFLARLYAQSPAKHLSFIGGTSLRLLHGIDRFSEDLDFDNLGLDRNDLTRLLTAITDGFKRENIDVELADHNLRFPRLLFDLQITTNSKEKLMIKVDYSTQWHGQTPTTVLLSKYGFIEQIIANPLSQIMVQKLAAYVTRARTQPRDMYDLVWLHSRGVRPDQEFMQANQMTHLIKQAQAKFATEGADEAIIRRLRPFLFDGGEIRKIQLLGKVLDTL